MMHPKSTLRLLNFTAVAVFSCTTFASAQTIIYQQELSPIPIGSTPYPQPTVSEFNWQPLFPYPGQLGNPATGYSSSWTGPAIPLSTLPAIGGQEFTPSTGSEIIVSEEPVDGIIIGHYENGQLIRNPSFSVLIGPYENLEVEIAEEEVDLIADPGQIEVLPEDNSVVEVPSERSDAESAVELESAVAKVRQLEADLEEARKANAMLVKEKEASAEMYENRLAKIQRKFEQTIASNASQASQIDEKADAGPSAAERELAKLKVLLRRAEIDVKNAKRTAEESVVRQRETRTRMTKLVEENVNLREKMNEAGELVLQLEKQLKGINRAHAAEVKSLNQSIREQDVAKKNIIKKLTATTRQLNDQRQANAKLKESFNKVTAAAVASQAKLAELEQSKSDLKPETDSKLAETKPAKTDAKTDDKAEDSSELSAKEKRIAARIADLRKEMKKKIEEARKRISAVGEKKIDALLKSGNAEDSEEVTAMQKKIARSIKTSDRKIRARYERKILKVK